MTPSTSVSATLTTQNTFSGAVNLDRGQTAAISITGTLAASTATLQRQVDGTNWRDVAQYTAVTEIDYVAATGMSIRVGIKTGDYSGSDSVGVLIKTG